MNNNNNNNKKKKDGMVLDNVLNGLVVFILVVVCVGIYLDIKKKKDYLNNKSGTGKEDYKQCPNYFKLIDGDICHNNLKLGKCHSNYDFNNIIKSNKNLLHNKHLQNKLKCEWAKQCRVEWDGIDRLC